MLASGRVLTVLAAAAMARAVEQIHISYTGVLGQLAVDFVDTKSAKGVVSFSTDNSHFTNATTSSFMFTEVGYMHQGLMNFTSSEAGAPAYYRVCAEDCSATFTVYPVAARYPAEKYAVFGDFGLANDNCMASLVDDAAKGVFDAVLHVGDWAYNMQDSASGTGNDFMNLVQGYGAVTPVMPAAGNHEACPSGTGCAAIPELPYSANNFTQYKARLHAVSMYAGANSGSGSNIFYSFSQGLVHFLVFSAEAYLYARDEAFLANQLAFMKADLAAVDRTATPWVVGLVHKDWTMEAEAYAAFGPILEQGGVDACFVGHVHYYNRYAPYNSVTNETDMASVSADGHTYTDPAYMVSIVTGASGDREGESGCTSKATMKPSLTCSSNYGYGYFTALNATHATWDFKTVKADGNGPADYADSLLIVQSNHGPRPAPAA